MAAAPSLPSFVRLQVCGDCRQRLAERFGAVHVSGPSGPHVINLDTRCEAHGRTGALAAAHVVELQAEHARILEAENDARPLAPLEECDDIHDAPLVAQLAVSLLGSSSFDMSSDDAIAFAVRTARRVLGAARGK